MIIGNGDIASVLPKNDKKLFFASGVSNSQETRESEFQREKDLLLRQKREPHLIYFSSLAVLYGKNRYAKHKREMELLVKKEFPLHTIMRLGNITWGTNPHTLINFFRAQIKEGKPLEIHDTYRYIIDKEEFLHWIDLIPNWSCEMNVPGRRMKVIEIVNRYCYINLEHPKPITGKAL